MASPAPNPSAPKPSGAPEIAWTPDLNPAMTALLDHLAEEFALEYVRLMEATAEDPSPEHPNQKD
jgi:hypothetical protein